MGCWVSLRTPTHGKSEKQSFGFHDPEAGQTISVLLVSMSHKFNPFRVVYAIYPSYLPPVSVRRLTSAVAIQKFDHYRGHTVGQLVNPKSRPF
jgi:hypothetical protein